jgi:tight adherence protein C
MNPVLLAALAGCAFACAWLASGAEPPRARAAPPRFRDLARAMPIVARAAEKNEAVAAGHECLTEVPRMLDMLTLGLSAGLSFDASLDLYCARSATRLADRMAATQLKCRLGVATRDQALADLANDLDAPALRRFASAVRESMEFGSPLAAVLARQADLMRTEQRLQLEESIEKVPIKMLVPLGCLVVPAMLLAIMGPLVAGALSNM